MHKVNGNLDGIRRSLIDRLLGIYEMEIDRRQFATEELLEVMAQFTGVTGREVMVYLDRSGRVEDVSVGEHDRVSLPVLRRRRSESRLSGLRCIHTHPGGNSTLSTVDVQALKNIRLDAMAAVGVLEGRPVSVQVGVLGEMLENDQLTVNFFGPYAANALPDDILWEEIEAADIRIRPAESKKAEAEISRAILVGIDAKQVQPLAELQQLADTAGFITVGHMFQARPRADRSYYLGHGKLQDLVLEIQKLQADTVIFDDELSPAQIRNIQKELGKKTEIIDRTLLILDIFSSRASTHEGRLQVELAHTKYMLPRMTGFWAHFSRMGGGGSGGGGGGARRGEGETQLEVDRRLLRRRLTELEKEIDKVKSRRDVQRVARERSNIPVVALVGYTNAGKSTLMNRLSGSDVLAENKLFATLDPKSRKVNFGGGEFLLVDTVGFINKLPHDLVNAFRATLEEARYADLLLHVVDSSHDSRDKQMEVVTDVLTQLGAAGNPTLTVYNKCDLITDPITGPDNIAISAATGLGMENLQDSITQKLATLKAPLSLLLPLDAGGLLSKVYASGQVHSCDYLENGIHLVATVTPEDAARLKAVAVEIY
ncbi:MAG: GTPase HflX [Defluviitaleaceae bacterium]|nr:GTPase HflX [Defluviitaleaceae bacterium]